MARRTRSPREPRIAWPLIVAAMAAVAFAGATAVRELTSDDSDGTASLTVERQGSTRIDGREPLRHDAAAPRTWRIRFRLANPGTEQTEVVTVRAPFESHTEVRTRGEFSEMREDALGIAVARPQGGALVGLAPPPEVTGFRPGKVMADAVDAGLVERREQRRVAGRVCQVYRTGSVFSGSTFVPPTSNTDYVDVCVDGQGLLLELVEFSERKLIRQRVATEVTLEVEVTDVELSKLPHEQTLPANQGGGSIRPVASTSQPVGPFFVVDAPPEGFSLLGRFEVVPPQPDIARPEMRGTVVAGMSDVFVNGPDAIVVERGSRLDKSDPWENDDRFPDLDLGPALGTGEFLAGITGGEVRVVLEGGRFVRVYGTVPRALLVSVAGALRQTEGGTGPDYLDD